MTEPEREITHLRELKAKHRQNIHTLEGQLASLGMKRPLDLVNELKFEREQLSQVEERLKELTDEMESRGAPPGPTEPMEAERKKKFTIQDGLLTWGCTIIVLLLGTLVIGGAIFLATQGSEPTAAPMLTSTCTVTAPTAPETLFALIDTEAQAVLDEDIDLIKTIFAPDAIIQNAATGEEWSSPEIYYAEKFRNEIHCQIEHYDYNVLKLTDTVALVTTASRGNWGWETEGCTETYDSPPGADQWHFRRDAFSRWRIVHFTYNTHTQ